MKRLTKSKNLEFDPTWSPDGQSIAYRHQRDFESPIDIFEMNADGSHERDLTGSEELAGWGPDWSPDGAWIAWNSATDTTSYFDQGLIHPDGTGHRVIKAGVYVEYPAWSPDGRRIAFMSPGEGSVYDIFVMNADGTDVRRLTDSPAPDGWPAWLAALQADQGCASGCLRGRIGPSFRRNAQAGAAPRRDQERPGPCAADGIRALLCRAGPRWLPGAGGGVMRWIVVVVAASLSLTACSNGEAKAPAVGSLSASTQTSSPGEQSPPPASESPQEDLSGTWAGTWANTTPDQSTGTFTIDWNQSAFSLAGTISITGTPCLTGGDISGAIEGQTISFGVVQGQVQVSYEGSVSDDGSEMSGTYSTDCGNAQGSWQAMKTA